MSSFNGVIIMNELEKTNHIILLIDMYGDLLTEKQQNYLGMYYE